MDVDKFVIFRDIEDKSDAPDVCQGPWTVSEEFETLSGFVVDGDVSRKPVSRTSAETEERLKSTDRTGCIPPGLVRNLYRATLMEEEVY